MPFKFMYRRAARESLRDGKLTKEQYDKIMMALRHPIRKRLQGEERVDLMAEVEKYTAENMPKGKLDWPTIVQWLKDHWMDILKLLLSLVVLLEQPPQEK